MTQQWIIFISYRDPAGSPHMLMYTVTQPNAFEAVTEALRMVKLDAESGWNVVEAYAVKVGNAERFQWAQACHTSHYDNIFHPQLGER